MSQEKQPFFLRDKFTEIAIELNMLKLRNLAEHMLDGTQDLLKEIRSSSISGPVYYPNKQGLIELLEAEELDWLSMIDEIDRVEAKLKKLLIS